MKKIIISIAILFLATIQMQSQWFFGKTIKGNNIMKSETRNVGDYNEISVAGSFDVALVKGEEGKIKIKMEENLLEYLITEVNNGKLVIKWKKGTNIRTKKSIHIVIPFTDIDAVSLLGSGDIIASDEIETTNFTTYLAGSGNITLNVSSKSTNVKVTGSGDIKLTGSTSNIDVLVTGSGSANSYNLKAKNADANITGSGNIYIFVSANFNAKVVGSGDITYTGNPENQNFKILGSGDIEAK
ncbi:MAG TPA: DUF2807 domain-containing protein [Flavobacteriaceae bacterium]|nr:DUF2807 domain-containing protein [Flavobacteriaceae bacterium]